MALTPSLITLDDALAQLRLPSVVGDEDDIVEKMSQATAIVIDYIKRPAHGWDATTVPDGVKAAILTQLTELYRYRGDDFDDASATVIGVARPPADGYLSPRVTRLLHRYRDPALA